MDVPDRIVVTQAKNCGIKNVQTIGKNARACRLLPDEYRKSLADKQIVCVEYQDITDADGREIFQVRHSLFFPPCLPSYRE